MAAGITPANAAPSIAVIHMTGCYCRGWCFGSRSVPSQRALCACFSKFRRLLLHDNIVNTHTTRALLPTSTNHKGLPASNNTQLYYTMADTEAVSIADTDSAVAGASVANTEAEEDRAMELLLGEEDVTSSSAPIGEGAGTTASSIAATDASVAGSSVAVTEVEEDILYSTRSLTINGGGSSNKKVILTKDSSLDLSICNKGNDEDDDDENNEADLAPMHLHALRSPAQLKGNPKSAARSRSSSRSRPSSRKNSPQPHRAMSNLVGTTISPSPSVGSSLDGSGVGEHVFDPDLLLDKLGLRDLDANASHDEIQELLKKHISSNNGLPTLNERLSEETLDDVHAFQDLVASSKKGSSGADDGDYSPGKAARDSLLRASQGPSSKILEVSLDALTEEDEDDDGLDQSGVGGRKTST